MKATRQWPAQEGLAAELRRHGMTEKLPCENEHFDAVMSVQVIQHADLEAIREIVDDISWVLKRRGFLFATVPGLRTQADNFEQLEPDTIMPLDGPERGLPCHDFTPGGVGRYSAPMTSLTSTLNRWEHDCLWAFRG